MKKLVFVIQLIFLYSGLAMADPVTVPCWRVGPKMPIRVSSSAATTVVRIT